MHMIRGAIALFLLLTFLAPAAQAEDSQKIKDIKQLLIVTHAQQRADMIVRTLMPQIIKTLRSGHPNVPARTWDEAQAIMIDEFSKSFANFNDGIVAIYDKNYTEEDVKELLAFYQSPLGQKVLSQTPEIMKESMEYGRMRGREIGQRAAQRLREVMKNKGYTI